MRILHVDKFVADSTLPQGGTASYVNNLLKLQKARGDDVFTFGPVVGGSDALPAFNDFATKMRPGLFGRMVHNTQAATKLKTFLRQTKIDVAHLHNIYHHLTPSILPVLAGCGIGVVMTVHDYRLACPTRHFMRSDGLCTRCVPNKFYHAASPACAGVAGAALAAESFIQRFFRRYVKLVDLFLCPTRYMLDTLNRIGVPQSKLRLVPPVAQELALPRGIDRSPNEFLYAGRLSAEKGPDLMLELAGLLPQARVVIAGDGPEMPAIRRTVADKSLTNVRLEGQVSREKLAVLLASAAALVLPSRCMENSPQSMLEAMLAGRCVIVPDQPPLREWVTDGVTGLVFQTASAESLAWAARKVINDPAGRDTMAAAGRELVRARHPEQAVLGQIEKAYRESIRRCALR